MKYALGIIETVGLAAGIQAADTAVKSANVRLIGYELTKGDGMATVKFEGNVGAVNAAIAAAKASASLVNKVYSYSVIARPSDGIDLFIRNDETVGYTGSTPPPVKPQMKTPEVTESSEAPVEEQADTQPEETTEASEGDGDEDVASKETTDVEVKPEIQATADVVEVDEADIVEENEEAEEADSVETTEEAEEDDSNNDEVCNICKDPKCTRVKGDLRRFCIHYYDNK